jgi:glycosyltransferase involved in cell wall biosynthesis
MPLIKKKKVLVDCRVFSTAAHDRGMGRYVAHLLSLLDADGHDITAILYENCLIEKDSQVLRKCTVIQAGYDPNLSGSPGSARLENEMHHASSFLTRTIEEGGFDVFIDAAPFLGPLRLDIFSCAVVAVCYDFIPLKYPESYLTSDVARSLYHNGLARLARSDSIICISETTATEAALYLGISSERLFVVYPKLEEGYLPEDKLRERRLNSDYMFAVLGAHEYKKPTNTVRLFSDLAHIDGLSLFVSVSEKDQQASVEGNSELPPQVKITGDISEERKQILQNGASFVAHMSMEDGFGISFLEAIFLDTKVLALDIPINKEITAKSSADFGPNVYYISPDSDSLDVAKFRQFLATPVDEQAFADIRNWFREHWSEAAKNLSAAIQCAEEAFSVWNKNLKLKVFSSIPGYACGVADYTMAYIRSCSCNVVLFFSAGQPEQVSILSNIKLVSSLDFECFSIGKFKVVKGLYNFAFSEALTPGIFLMKRFANSNDAILIHERYYFDQG